MLVSNPNLAFLLCYRFTSEGCSQWCKAAGSKCVRYADEKLECFHKIIKKYLVYSGVQIHVVKGLFHKHFDHFYLDSRIEFISTTK